MRNILRSLVVTSLMSLPALAGGFYIQAENPSTRAEAVAQHAVVLTSIKSCASPELTTVTATAEGLVNGARKTLPLRVTRLSDVTQWAVVGDWPSEGAWTVRVTARNPKYETYSVSMLVPVDGHQASFAAAKIFRGNPPTPADITAALTQTAQK